LTSGVVLLLNINKLLFRPLTKLINKIAIKEKEVGNEY